MVELLKVPSGTGKELIGWSIRWNWPKTTKSPFYNSNLVTVGVHKAPNAKMISRVGSVEMCDNMSIILNSFNNQ